MHRFARTLFAVQKAIRDLGPGAARSPHAQGLPAAVNWLCRAQDATPDGGVSAGYHLRDGWLASYPETTGYIAATFFDLANLAATRANNGAFEANPDQHEPPADEHEREWESLPSPLDLAGRAARMLDWLLTLQHAAGGFPGQFGTQSTTPIVFNTGQILFGLVRGCEYDPARDDWRAAACRAATWLRDTRDDDGCWRRGTFGGVPHVYNTRVAWALLRAASLLDEPSFRTAAEHNLHWAVQQRNSTGWFHQCGFAPAEPVFTHTIAYCLRGLYESGVLLDDEELIGIARIAAQRPAHALLRTNRLPGAYAASWKPAGSFRCLTGEAQLAILWSKLAERFGSELFARASDLALTQVGAAQEHARRDEVRGALPGSRPIWGKYMRACYPNWATKFLIDALLERRFARERRAANHTPDQVVRVAPATVGSA